MTMHERGPRQPIQRETEAINPRRIERVLPDEFEVVVGSKEGALQRAIPLWGEKIAEGIIEAVASGSVQEGILVFEDRRDETTRRIDLHNPTGQDVSMRIGLSGDWREGELTPPGLPLSLPQGKGEEKDPVKLYRRLTADGDPLMEVGKKLEPNSAIAVRMKGKKNKVVLRLPKDQFPKGGTVTAVNIPDDAEGIQVVGGYVYAYVDPIQ